ncbi:hypothetical protein BHE74_00041452 [Ensete ventricosum]|uniref:Uncharacterized protein n=1 Tax=Ensete ventricosum TaxID=4639 RepID=A0A426X218_ENSVE|nr:hypothetical protein B296_00055978 [Ensete ventricosum]RWW25758.1 hypothetical protein GW17_00009891 [Ensete ventricosum]RWW52147.1 hypothetical protein BHE74_00041452 [Ensete ventricosum]RZS17791.1 hypothetical protein BHM03_00049974 [Ensete ventricosum]
MASTAPAGTTVTLNSSSSGLMFTTTTSSSGSPAPGTTGQRATTLRARSSLIRYSM